jgi:hypothetical protein
MKVRIFITVVCSVLTLGYCLGQSNVTVPSNVEVLVKQDGGQSEKSIAEQIRDWLTPVSTFLSVLAVAYGVIQSLKEYRLKLRAEMRLADSTTVEMNIKLMQSFTELLAIAHARKNSYLSEKTVEKMFDKSLFTKEELANPDLLRKKIQSAAILNVACGEAEQSAFVAAITELALRHQILENPTKQALETMKSFLPDLAQKYLDELNRNDLPPKNRSVLNWRKGRFLTSKKERS